jgi:hypothetical protein
MDLIQGYIYSNQPEPPSLPKNFLQRHLRGFGIAISVVFHISILAWIFYQGVFAPFTDMAFVDEAYNEVKWVEIVKLAQPLKYPPSLLPNPGRVVSLDELERQRQEAEQKARAKKKKEELKKKEQKEEEAAKEDESEKKEEENETAENDAKATEPAEPAEPEKPPAGPPKFGLINARPIRDIVGKVYTVYKTGGLDIENTVFSITLGFEVKPDGSLDNVRILKSSGSQQIDTAAVNIAGAISESHALMPLAALSSTTAALELNAEKATLKIAGYTDNSAIATDMATTFGQQLAGLRLLMSVRNQVDAATLLSHLQVSNQGNELAAVLSMSRAEASALMRKNFGSLIPASNNKQPEVSEKNLMNGLSGGSDAF